MTDFLQLSCEMYCGQLASSYFSLLFPFEMSRGNIMRKDPFVKRDPLGLKLGAIASDYVLSVGGFL